MVFAVAANIDPEEMLKVMRENLADAKPGRAFSHDIAAEPPVLGPRTVVATFPRLGQARVNLAFPSVSQTDPDMYALDLLATILGGGESSILVEDVRDSKQLCSGIMCGDDTPAYVSGSFEIEMGLDPGNISAATEAVLGDIEKIKADGVDDDRMRRAKAAMKIEHLKNMQTSQDVAATMATDYLSTGDVHFSDRYVERIGAVTAEQLKEVARKYLVRERLVTTALLPREAVGAGGLPKAEDLLKGRGCDAAVGDGGGAGSGRGDEDGFGEWAGCVAPADHDDTAGEYQYVCARGSDGGGFGEQWGGESGDGDVAAGDDDAVGGGDRGFLRSDGRGAGDEMREQYLVLECDVHEG